MNGQSPSRGQIRWWAKTERTSEGGQVTTNTKSEAWTGAEWVDVRVLVECWNARNRTGDVERIARRVVEQAFEDFQAALQARQL